MWAPFSLSHSLLNTTHPFLSSSPTKQRRSLSLSSFPYVVCGLALLNRQRVLNAQKVNKIPLHTPSTKLHFSSSGCGVGTVFFSSLALKTRLRKPLGHAPFRAWAPCCIVKMGFFFNWCVWDLVPPLVGCFSLCSSQWWWRWVCTCSYCLLIKLIYKGMDFWWWGVLIWCLKNKCRRFG